jgi:FecR protein
VIDDYLWNRSGEPDPEIHKLEAVLRLLRHNRPAPNFSAVERAPVDLWKNWWLPGLLATTALALLVGVHFISRARLLPAAKPGWAVASMAGSPRIESKIIVAQGKLRVGETLETDGQSRASVSVPDVGQVDIGPNTRLRLVQAQAGHNQMSLQRGTIAAIIWAAPGQFAVDTPAAVAVDLGCRYTLHVDDTGAGLLRTISGWVGFKLGDRESFIPAGAACATRPKIGPGTPYFEDASPTFREALARFDFQSGSAEEHRTELALILANARRRDAVTLWHLLTRVSGHERGLVYDRLAALIPPSEGVTREGVIVHLDRKMLDLWWSQLGLGTASWWRIWEQSWSKQKQSSR